MKGRYVLAADGGATKTHGIIYDCINDRMFFVEGGPSSHEFLAGGFDESCAVLSYIAETLTKQAVISFGDIEHATYGLAGLDVPHQYSETKKRILASGIRSISLYNDAFLPILAASESGCGIGVVNGTGFSAAGIGKDGGRIQLGGFHELSGDCGGGKWYTEQVIQSIYRMIFLEGENTILSSLVSDRTGISADESFMEKVNQMIEKDLDGLRLICCMSLHEAADSGDSVSQNILRKSAEQYAKVIGSATRRLNFDGVEIIDTVLTGSQFTKGSVFLKNELEKNLDDRIKLSIPDYPPIAGALFDALRSIGIYPERERMFSRVREVVS